MTEGFQRGGGWRATGAFIRTDSVDRLPDYDPRSGDHLWTWAAMWRFTEGVEEPILDAENLLLITGPGCYYCEQGYSARLARRRCTGHPK